MEKKLLQLPHEVGVHCTSTSIRDVYLYDGLAISEAAVFGLGSGLGFFYISKPHESPSVRLNGRALDLEAKFYRNTGYDHFVWEERWSPEAIAHALDRGRPVLAKMDIFHLPYYQPPVHFVMHTVVVAAIDLAARTITVADTASDALLTITLDEFQAAVNVNDPPMMTPYHWAIAPECKPVLHREYILRSLYTTAREMLLPDFEVIGLPAMRRLADDFPAWKNMKDWAWCARFAYQSMEKRGTGGGSFRLLYADFLEEISTYVPELDDMHAADKMRHIGQQWVDLAQICKTVFVEEDPSGFAAAGRLTAHIADLEARVMQDFLHLAG